MAQHDLTIANDTGANVRGDVQSMGQALASTSKGNTRPAGILAGQHWIDDNTPSSSIWTEYVYDGADDIVVGYIDTSTNSFTPASSIPRAGTGGVGGAYYVTGDVLFGQNATTTPGQGNSTLGATISSNGSAHFSNNGAYVVGMNRNGNGTIMPFSISGTVVGSITVSGSSTAYNTSSDRRLKTDIEPIDGREAVAELAKLRPVWFHWIGQPLGEWVDGFIADEVQAHMPHVVTGAPDATETVTHRLVRGADGTRRLEPLDQPFERIVPQGIDQSKFTPLLVAAVNALAADNAELRASVEALAARVAEDRDRIAALEAAGAGGR